MSKITKYFDSYGNETTPQNAYEVIVQEVDKTGKLVHESKYYRK